LRFGVTFSYANYWDWDRFEALERGEEVGPPAVPDRQIWAGQLALADLAEPLGFDTLWTVEQHAAPYLMVPDPTQYLTIFAARTRRLDVGSMITVLLWHNPFRLAEQISVLQHVLGPDRKYFLGVGRGLARRNFDAMGVDMLADGIWGTPEQCVERIIEHHEEVNPSEIIVLLGTGTMTGPQMEKAMRLYGEKVLPRVAHLRTEKEAVVAC